MAGLVSRHATFTTFAYPSAAHHQQALMLLVGRALQEIQLTWAIELENTCLEALREAVSCMSSDAAFLRHPRCLVHAATALLAVIKCVAYACRLKVFQDHQLSLRI